MEREFAVSRCKPVYVRWINKVLLYISIFKNLKNKSAILNTFSELIISNEVKKVRKQYFTKYRLLVETETTKNQMNSGIKKKEKLKRNFNR